MEKIKSSFVFFKEFVAPYIPFLLLLVFFTPTNGHPWDTECWTEWAKYHYVHGLSNIYKSWTDYLPLYHYVLYVYAKLQPNLESVATHIHYLKYVTLFFEFLSTLLLSRLLYNTYGNRHKTLYLSLFYLLNIGVIYNSLVWGQVDGIMSFFVFASILAAYKKRLFVSLLCLILAINMKLQAIIFLPVVVALLIPEIQKSYKKTFLGIAGILFVQVLIIMPFWLAGDISKLLHVVFGSVGKFPVVSMNAYNFWLLTLNNNLNLTQVPDSTIYLGITYKHWGLMLFFISSFGALFHFIAPLWKSVVKKEVNTFSFRELLISSALIPLVFFFFNTQMHERYSHPALIFLAAYALLYKRLFLLVLGSAAYFLNLEDLLQVMQTNNYGTLIFMARFIAGLYAVLILLLYIDLFNPNLKRKHNGN